MEQDSVTIDYTGVWEAHNIEGLSDGKSLRSNRAEATITYTFYGTGVEWVAPVNYNMGMAKVTLDDEAPCIIDLYNPNEIKQKKVYKRYGLQLDKHMLRIEVMGAKSASSTELWVYIDAIDVLNPVTVAPAIPQSLEATAEAGSMLVMGKCRT